mmetsp:Transcript_15955/g.36810  ORF Transcript_15955/g.36810 Transcript_15955/m.36810 type:complete len:105 (-) Transcript_15955:11-325(-)
MEAVVWCRVWQQEQSRGFLDLKPRLVAVATCRSVFRGRRFLLTDAVDDDEENQFLVLPAVHGRGVINFNNVGRSIGFLSVSVSVFCQVSPILNSRQWNQCSRLE